MLYRRNTEETLDPQLFAEPTSEYRGAPFWAWNCALSKDELLWQLEVLRKMGFGGAHMHTRTGQATPYLGEHYFELVKACVQKAKDEGMLAWLYDEDRWPSGAAGGLVTKDHAYRTRYLVFTPHPYEEETQGMGPVVSTAAAAKSGNGTLLACFDVELTEEGRLIGSRRISAEENAAFEKWYAYMEIGKDSPWFNNQAYLNTLDKAAVDRFIEVTHEKYFAEVGEDFGGVIPAIFTDEPQFTRKSTLRFAREKADVILPWTDDLPDTYAAAYAGEDLLQGLPELIWDRADGEPSLIRYHYHDHVCQRFTEAFAKNCGSWCREHGLRLTGHMMEEDTLTSQTAALGEAMRAYPHFGLPGIDMLCAAFHYNTAKQTQSAVHQCGKEGMTSELYGVTNWDFDFRGHKLHGDWQAALGVTVRVPHLSWVSMRGEAKRDYPASINYQSPWWEKYPLIEDHFARLNTAMTRGKALVKVGVIHPVESYWLHWGPTEQTALKRNDLETNFTQLTEWLLFGGIDFDFISESLLPELCETPAAPLPVGEMAYDAIIVPACETLRETTLLRLEAFAKAGGKLLILGEAPRFIDGRRDGRGEALAALGTRLPLLRGAVLEALEGERVIELRDASGALTDNLLYQMRIDGEGRWVFIAHGKEPYNPHVSRREEVTIRLAGEWAVTLYDTMSGEIRPLSAEAAGGETKLRYSFYEYDSLLLRLEPLSQKRAAEKPAAAETETAGRRIPLPEEFSYTLSEPNVLLLDQAEFSLDGGEWQPKEEILRIDSRCREKLHWVSRAEHSAQPWVQKKTGTDHSLRLRFRILSGSRFTGVSLALEDAESVKVFLNGRQAENRVTGWYVDKSIQTLSLGTVEEGENLLELLIPYGEGTNVEWAYLLGDFGVEIIGRGAKLVPMREKLAFGDITVQGFPFYGGNLSYQIPVETEKGQLSLRSGMYAGALQTVRVDGAAEVPAVFPPYRAELGTVEAGRHLLELTLYGHRRNSFGPVHLSDLRVKWIGPSAWRSRGDSWSYAYRICEEGILETPELTLY